MQRNGLRARINRSGWEMERERERESERERGRTTAGTKRTKLKHTAPSARAVSAWKALHRVCVDGDGKRHYALCTVLALARLPSIVPGVALMHYDYELVKSGQLGSREGFTKFRLLQFHFKDSISMNYKLFKRICITALER